jgi:molybdate transport system ATP-binding protein
MLEVDIEHRLADFALDIHFRAGRAPTALFGRSGAGKTSVINAIAGLLRPRRGRIAMDGSVLLDTERAICVPTHRRRVGCVFQEGRLFPHLTVRQNLLFGRWFAPARERRVTNLDDVGRLSGGEKQRVAIGRALLASPRLLLMDEPPASLDARRKDEIPPYLERLRDEARVPIVYGDFGRLTVPRLDAPVGTALRVRIRARDVILAVTRHTGISALNVLAAEVDRLVPIEEGALEVQLRLGGERLCWRE